MKNVQEITESIGALSEADRDALLESLVIGVLHGARDKGHLAELLNHSLGLFGIYVVTIDARGVARLDAWDERGPQGARVRAVMDAVEGAVVPAIDRVMAELGGARRTERSDG